MTKIKVTMLAASVVFLLGCDDVEINNNYIQKSLTASNGALYDQNTAFEGRAYMDYDLPSISPRLGYCFNGSLAVQVCAETSFDGRVGYDEDWVENYQALDLDNKTVRFKTFNEATNPEQDLIPLIINKAYSYSSDWESRLIDSAKRIESTIGQRIFQREILYVDIHVEDEFAVSRDDLYNGSYMTNDSKLSADGVATSYKQLIKENPHVAGGIIMSVGSNVVYKNCGDSKGSVSYAPKTNYIPSQVIDSEGYLSNEGFVWVNLGVVSGTCNNLNNVSNSIIDHELGHLIGLADHFEDYGHGAAWGDGAKAVLKALYNNPLGTPYDLIEKP
ncbi:hypothetical protein [Shewanella goraebulensis]|uniref:hypothetical protein n=1 Tax=Shewanella goraebulensis TaxID=3050637 RepID=UPI00254FF9B8|nr:hypothetical protein [Shewanella goraebulensis]